MKTKNELLNTKMNELGLGGAFNNWFFDDKRMKQHEVLMLKDFITLNRDLKINTDEFVCRVVASNPLDRRGFIKASTSWNKLKKFLLENNFTHDDWIMLLGEYKSSKGQVYDYSLLDKPTLFSLPVNKVTDAKANCQPLQTICSSITNSNDIKGLTVKVLLTTKQEILQARLGGHFLDRTIQHTLSGIQNRFFAYGLTQKDGPFMKMRFGSIKTSKDYVDDLVQNKKFTRNKAIRAVKLGIEAGWIQV